MDWQKAKEQFGYAFIDVVPIHKGMSSDQKYRVTLDDGRKCLLRLSSVDQFERKQAEYIMMRAAFENGIRVSTPYAFDVIDNETVYQLTEWLNGHDLETLIATYGATENYALGVKAAELLKKIHAIPVPITTTPWKERFYQKLLMRLEQAQRVVPNAKLTVLSKYIIDHIDFLSDCTQCFNHGDFNPENLILLENSDLAAVDFNSYDSGYGEPIFETTTILLDDGINADFRHGFESSYFSGYANDSYKPLLNYYRTYDLLARLCEAWDDNSKAQLLNQIERLITEL